MLFSHWAHVLLVVVVIPDPLLNRIHVREVERVDPFVNGRRIRLDCADGRQLAQVPNGIATSVGA